MQLKNVIRRLTLGTADFEQNNTQYLWEAFTYVYFLWLILLYIVPIKRWEIVEMCCDLVCVKHLPRSDIFQ